VLSAAIERVAEEKFSNITAKGQREKAIKQWISRNEYPLTDFVDALRYDEESNDWAKIDICDYWKNEKAKDLFELVVSSWKALLPTLDTDEKIGLRDRENDVKAIKEYLDSVLNVIRLVKPLSVGTELERDTDFYGQFDELYDILDDVVPLYNQTRNYITSKPSEEKKLKLMFDSPTLADGWDQNQEEANKAVLLEKDGQFYLGIVNAKLGKKERPDFLKLISSDSSNCYRKMVYKLLPGPNKMLPKVFFSNKGLPVYKPSSRLLERYKNGDYKKGATFDLQFCHQLIDFFKKSISIHPDWSKFGFEFSPTSSYSGVDDFYREISNQGYKISFDNIDEKVIGSFVDSGALYLFKLHNKDFSSGAIGRQNLHTIYWKMLFVSENLDDVIFKLNGEAELFYRRASIKNPYIHKLGKKLVNRIDKDGKRIPDEAFGKLVELADGEITVDELSGVAKDLYDAGKVEMRDVKHEIIKDRRFAEDKFFFHVPITINAKANDKASRFNDLVNDAVRNFSGVNIIGIDRGERHLLYVTVIDSKGKILEQRSFNTIDIDRYDGKRIDVDYHAKLDQMEKDRDKARKSWSEIGKIKDLKSGYLSMVVHEIAKLMVKYNAIVVLEDLNGGFKRGRSAIEKQVYQKFEKAMIDKLNYLVFKDSEHLSLGGALRGYQLADKFESFEKLGKQTGFIYYVPAAYTSKIDPTTGFTNIFDFKKCTSAEGIKRFFNLFDSIKYSAADDAFIFAFDYNKFDTRFPSWNSKWDVYSASRRLVYDKGTETYIEINPTNIIIEALIKRGVAMTDEFNLGEYMKETDATRESSSLFKSVFYAFERTLQMRNSSAKTGEDYIESPVKNSSGEFFDSRKCGKELPENADANGAYHIALKGLLMVDELKTNETPKLAIKNEDWLEFVQSRHV
jgi:CRISPR-associated protein Cpf1